MGYSAAVRQKLLALTVFKRQQGEELWLLSCSDALLELLKHQAPASVLLLDT